jgi:hypothetical protein
MGGALGNHAQQVGRVTCERKHVGESAQYEGKLLWKQSCTGEERTCLESICRTGMSSVKMRGTLGNRNMQKEECIVVGFQYLRGGLANPQRGRQGSAAAFQPEDHDNQDAVEEAHHGGPDNSGRS